MRSLIAQSPVATLVFDHLANPTLTSAWTLVIPAMLASACAVEVFDSSGKILQISTGDPGVEDNSIVKYTITPNGSSVLLPLEFTRGRPISIRAVDAATTEGNLILNFFG